MATITSKSIVDEIIERNGVYPGDRPIVKIVEYSNGFDGGTAWGLIYQGEDLDRYAASPFIRNPKVIFERTPPAPMTMGAVLESMMGDPDPHAEDFIPGYPTEMDYMNAMEADDYRNEGE